jgi:hypothetical protein
MPGSRTIQNQIFKTGEMTLDTQNPGNVQEWTADHDLQIRATQVTTDNGGTLIRVRDDVKSAWRELIKLELGRPKVKTK